LQQRRDLTRRNPSHHQTLRSRRGEEEGGGGVFEEEEEGTTQIHKRSTYLAGTHRRQTSLRWLDVARARRGRQGRRESVRLTASAVALSLGAMEAAGAQRREGEEERRGSPVAAAVARVETRGREPRGDDTEAKRMSEAGG
jgi:hypothetical protein